MEAFQIGPFDYSPAQSRRLNGVMQTEWSLSYGAQLVGAVWVSGERAQVVEALAGPRADFARRMLLEHDPDQLMLRRWSDGAPLDVIKLRFWPEGLSGCIPNDTSEYWAEVVGTTHRMPVTLQEWGAMQRTHGAPALAWIAGLLPDEVLAHDPAGWRAPTSWEIRHVVGEGSFTGVTGAQAAALVGVTPQNFRKYTARDGASTRQAMSFAMWHLLLHKLGVQSTC